MFRVEQSSLQLRRLERRNRYVAESIDDTLQMRAAFRKRQRQQQFAVRAHEVKCHENDGNCAPNCVIHAFSANALTQHREGKRPFGLQIPSENLAVKDQARSSRSASFAHLRKRFLDLRKALGDVFAIARVDRDAARLCWDPRSGPARECRRTCPRSKRG